jgi:hypothetical protein
LVEYGKEAPSTGGSSIKMVPFVVVPDVVEFNAAANTAVELVIVATAAVMVMFSEENADAEVDEIDEGRTTE